MFFLLFSFVSYPCGPTPVPPGQYHESPTEQYWNNLPADQAANVTGQSHPNANPYSQNCNINNNLNYTEDYDGNGMITDRGWS